MVFGLGVGRPKIVAGDGSDFGQIFREIGGRLLVPKTVDFGTLAPIKRAVLVGLAYSSGWMSSQNWAWVCSVGVNGQMHPSKGR